MAMTLTKLVAGTASDYFTSTADMEITDHGGDMANYYNAPGTPPGRWMGHGVAMFGKNPGEVAEREDVTRLYDELVNPADPEQRLTQIDPSEIKKGHVVAGYDLTFTMPKSVNVLWACGDENIRRTITQCQNEAVEETLSWFEEHEAYGRMGHGGVAKVRAKGVAAVSFRHWDTRDHDPHLHDHVLVSNYVERPDGTIGALDGKCLYRNAVYLSERETNLLMDKLTERLGVQWRERRGDGSKAAIYDIVGVDERLIDHFSQRHANVTRAKRELMAKARSAGTPLTPALLRRIDNEAWRSTRKTKPKDPMSLHELMDQWADEMRLLGEDPQTIIDRSCGDEISSVDVERIIASPDALGMIGGLLNDDITEHANTGQRGGGRGSGVPSDDMKRTDPNVSRNADVDWRAGFIDDVEHSSTRITESSIRAAAERITRTVRVNQKGRDKLTDAITEQEKRRLVELTPGRYTLPAGAENDPELSDSRSRASVDTPEGHVYATPALLAAERTFKKLSERRYLPAEHWTNDLIQARMSEQQKTAEHPLADDQQAAVKGLLMEPRAITALSGAAGTGKTTTLRTLARMVDAEQGEGRILGIAPTAVAATELGNSIGVAADTLAKILDEDIHNRIGARLDEAIGRYNATPPWRMRERRSLRERIAGLQAQKTSLTIPQDGIVLVDESGMADTFSLTHLARMCAAAGAKMIMVGDDHQLDTPGGGAGAFAWMVDQQRDVQLTSVWRFKDPKEAERSIELRKAELDEEGRSPAIRQYDKVGRIHAAESDEIRRQAVERLVTDLENGADSLLIVGGNDELAELNERVSRLMDARHMVDGSRRVTLSDGSTAAVGDIICSRRNERRLTTSNGHWVRNNDLWQIDNVTPEGVECHRKGDKNDRLTMPHRYVANDVVGGYVLTPHRAQGKTVDHGYFLVTLDGRAKCSELYVAMTRGRSTNEAYVETKPLADMMVGQTPKIELAEWRQAKRALLEEQGLSEWKGKGPRPDKEHWYEAADLDPTPKDQALHRLDTIVADNRIGRFASQWAENYDRDMHSIDRLGSEHSYFAQVLAQRRLETLIGADRVEAMSHEDTWRQLLDAYAEAAATDRQRADEIMTACADQGSREARIQLRRHITDPADHRTWAAARYWREPAADMLPDGEREAAELLNQASNMMDDALSGRLTELADPDDAPSWVKNICEIPSPGSEGRKEWEATVLSVQAYRAARRIPDNDPEPLGTKEDHIRDGWRERVERRLSGFRPVRAAADPDVLDEVHDDIRRLPEAKARAVRAGRSAVITVGGAEPQAYKPRTEVKIPSKDPAATIRALRRVDRSALANVRIVGADDRQENEIWNALTARERGMVTVEGGGTGSIGPLWRSMVDRGRERGGLPEMQKVVDGLDDRKRVEAIGELNRDQAVPSSARGQMPPEAPAHDIGMSGPSMSGV
jgi:conjugative relaxase-like TrwC/TraI family protein